MNPCPQVAIQMTGQWLLADNKYFTGYHQIYANPLLISWLPRSCVSFAWTPGFYELLYLTT